MWAWKSLQSCPILCNPVDCSPLIRFTLQVRKGGTVRLCQARLPTHTACLFVLAWPSGQLQVGEGRHHTQELRSLPLLSLCSPAQHLSLSLWGGGGGRPCNPDHRVTRQPFQDAAFPPCSFCLIQYLPGEYSSWECPRITHKKEGLLGRPAGIYNIHLSASCKPKS